MKKIFTEWWVLKFKDKYEYVYEIDWLEFKQTRRNYEADPWLEVKYNWEHIFNNEYGDKSTWWTFFYEWDWIWYNVTEQSFTKYKNDKPIKKWINNH